MGEIGSTLREARMRARIDMSEVEARTKIRAKYLRAIENEEWDLLPGSVYAKSFLRSYGDFLGLDSRMLVEEFKRLYEEPHEHELRPLTARARERDRAPKRRVPAWAPVGGVVVAIIVVLYIIVGSSTSSNTSSTSARNPVAPRHHRTRPTTTATRTTPAAPANVKLRLTPTGTVYICLVNARGTRLINQQTFTVGQSIPPEGGAKLLLTLGNASVQMRVDGKPVPVAPSAAAIRLEITSAGVTHIPASVKPICP